MGRYTRNDLLNYHPDKKFLDPYFSNREEEMVTPYGDQSASFGKFAIGAGAIGYGAAKVASRAGINLFDPVYAGIRSIEELSPGKIFRTFQAGNFLSQFTTQGRAPLSILPDAIKVDSEWFRDLVYRTQGRASAASLTGLQFADGRLMSGSEVLLENATKMTNIGSPYLPAAYSRSAGYKGLPNIDSANRLRMNLPQLGAEQSIHFMGGPTKSGAVLSQMKALVTESIFERANRLADAPFGAEPFSTGLSGARKIWENATGRKFTLAVRSGSAPEMLKGMGIKWGGILTAATLGYLGADHLVKNSTILDSTVFKEGITEGIASIGVKANLFAAKLADIAPGARSYQQTQEEFAPGSTSLTKLLAFPASGLLAGGTAYYGLGLLQKRKAISDLMAQGLSYTDSLIGSEEAFLKARAVPINNPVTNLVSSTLGKKFSYFKNITKGKALLFGGVAAGFAAILPFLPGALLPSSTEAELEDIYSGRKEVAVKKSRFWELGKTPYEGTKALYYRPHWYPRMIQDSYDKSVYGNDSPNPAWKWIKENFTYDVEKAHYQDRPYPITGAAFADIPIVGPLLFLDS